MTIFTIIGLQLFHVPSGKATAETVQSIRSYFSLDTQICCDSTLWEDFVFLFLIWDETGAISITEPVSNIRTYYFFILYNGQLYRLACINQVFEAYSMAPNT